MKIFLFTICFFLVFCSTHCFSGEKVNYNAYFDMATGHKYVKLDSTTYAEFSKKGEFLKNVPSNLLLLINSSNIYPIPDKSYILYERAAVGTSDHKLIPNEMDHPKGWKAKKICVSLN